MTAVNALQDRALADEHLDFDETLAETKRLVVGISARISPERPRRVRRAARSRQVSARRAGSSITKRVPIPAGRLDPDATGVALDDAVGERQAEARALPDRLGGVEGLEDAVAHVGGNAGAVVLELEAHQPVRVRACGP